MASSDSLNAPGELLKHCRQIVEELRDSLLLAKCLILTGEVSNDLFEYRNSFEAYTQVLNTSLALKDTTLLLDALDGLIDSSLSAAKKSEYPEVYCHALTNFAITLFGKDKERAFQYIRIAIESARKLTSPSRALVYALTKGSIIYIQDDRGDSAILNLYKTTDEVDSIYKYQQKYMGIFR